MKKWFKFFALGFFSHKHAKEAARRDYANVFLGFVLALVCLWSGFVGGEMLPFGAHYNNAPDFKATVYSALANADADKRIDVEIENGVLKAKKQGSKYSESLWVNTFESETDKQNYSANGYDIVIDTRPADALAEIEAYCLSNDGKETEISYQDYLTLSEVARLNFDFKLRYTGREFKLNGELVEGYRAYLEGSSDENKAEIERLDSDLAENKITSVEYDRAIYELYFSTYYPEITEYESTSLVPLLRNYYYHQYITAGVKNYLFIFDDYMTASFETKSGIEVIFHGFYSNLDGGSLVNESAGDEEAQSSVDDFIKNSFKATGILNLYAYAMNVLSLLPFIALMIMVATMLTYSIFKLRCAESTISLGAMLKIVGSFVWFSGVVSAVCTLIMAFFVPQSLISALPLVIFFLTLAVRSIIFAINESKIYIQQLEQQEAKQMEV